MTDAPSTTPSDLDRRLASLVGRGLRAIFRPAAIVTVAAEAERRGLTRSELVRQTIVASTGEAAPAPTPEAGQ